MLMTGFIIASFLISNMIIVRGGSLIHGLRLKDNVVRIGESAETYQFSRDISFPGGGIFSCSIPVTTQNSQIYDSQDESLARKAALRGSCQILKSGADQTWEIVACSSGRAYAILNDEEVTLGHAKNGTFSWNPEKQEIYEKFEPDLNCDLTGPSPFCDGIVVKWLCGQNSSIDLPSMFNISETSWELRFSSEFACNDNWRIKELLKASLLSHNNCIEGVLRGKWLMTYCMQGYVSQHVIPENRTFVLGLHGQEDSLSYSEISTDDVLSSKDFRWNSSYPMHFSSHVYKETMTNGTICMDTKEPRSVDILFQCPSDFKEQALGLKDFRPAQIISAIEPKICKYVIVIETPAVCVDPRMRWNRKRVDDDEIRCTRKDN